MHGVVLQMLDNSFLHSLTKLIKMVIISCGVFTKNVKLLHNWG